MNENKFIMERVSFLPSLVCNLNCALCCTRIPYLKREPLSLERMKEISDRYFKVVDYVKRLSLSGGEPLLYPHLPELIDYLSENYSDKIGEMEIFTNGTLIPSERLICSIRKFPKKCFFRVDNYGETISKKVKEIKSVLDKEQINYDIRDYCSENAHCGGWVDYGDCTELKHSMDEAKILYSKCACPQKLRFSFALVDGIMTPCDPVHNRMEAGVKVNENEYIDLFDDKLSVDEQRDKINAIYNATVLDTCAYCNGMLEDSPRFMPGKQLTQEEIAAIRRAGR